MAEANKRQVSFPKPKSPAVGVGHGKFLFVYLSKLILVYVENELRAYRAGEYDTPNFSHFPVGKAKGRSNRSFQP